MGSIVFLGGLVVAFILLWIIIMAVKNTSGQKNTFLRLYLLVISIVAIGGGTIALGFFVYPTLTKVLISDAEYGRNRRQYTQCADNYYPKPIYMDREMYTYEADAEVLVATKDEQQIADCQEQALAQI